MGVASILRFVQSSDRPLGAKLQIIAHIDPDWVKHLEIVVNWKLSQLGIKKAS